MKTDKTGRCEFIEEQHIYLLDGVKELPSVTTLIHQLDEFKDMYTNVPKHILSNKATFGSNVHLAIECDSKGLPMPTLDYLEKISFEQYKKLQARFNICPIENEMIVFYKDIYAGTLDGIFDINYSRCLVDVKTTAKLEKEYLSWQLGFYKLALEWMGYPKLADYFAIHLPKKDVGSLVRITPKTEKDIHKFLKAQGYE